jgi:hypothetical protein
VKVKAFLYILRINVEFFSILLAIFHVFFLVFLYFFLPFFLTCFVLSLVPSLSLPFCYRLSFFVTFPNISSVRDPAGCWPDL